VHKIWCHVAVVTFLLWCLIYEDPQYGTCFVSPFW